ncbi:MAG: hypothetical protein AAF438_15900, partial [Pseudomonadota bacterium]
MDIYTTIITISILIYIAIGNYAGRGIRRLDDYYVAGRNAPTLVILGAFFTFAPTGNDSESFDTFFGLRDFIFFLKALRSMSTMTAFKLIVPVRALVAAIERNFNGVDA